MVASPARTNCIASPMPRRRGRISHDEIEAATPAGRALQWLETRLYDAGRALTHLFTAHERETLFDADCDERVGAAIVALDNGNPLEARALLLEYRERDALRDAEHHAQHRHATTIRTVHQGIGGWLDRSLEAVRAMRGGRS